MTISVKSKMVLAMVTVFTLAVVALSTVSYRSFSESSETMKKESLDTIARAVGKAVSEKTEMYFASLELASRMFNGAQELTTQAGYLKEAMAFFRIDRSEQAVTVRASRPEALPGAVPERPADSDGFEKY